VSLPMHYTVSLWVAVNSIARKRIIKSRQPASQPATKLRQWRAQGDKGAVLDLSASTSIPYNTLMPICAAPKRNDATNSISPSSRQEHCFYNTEWLGFGSSMIQGGIEMGSNNGGWPRIGHAFLPISK
jgi:hypothetical protein